jgi:hypothetical protein
MSGESTSISMISASRAVLGEEDSYIGIPSPPEEIPELKIASSSHVTYHAEGWIACHLEREQRVLRTVLDSVRYVRHDEFVRQLSSTTGSVIEQLTGHYARAGKSFIPDRDTVVLVEKHKSNQWVAELALHHFNFMGNLYMALGSKDAVAFTNYLSSHPEIAATLQDKTIILFDDASFSGKQLHDHVRAIQSVRGIRSIGVIAPFMTAHADRIIRALSRDHCPVFLGAHETITTLDTIPELDAPAKTQLCELWGYTASEIRNLGLTWFSHKIPNYQSFPQVLAHGSIYSCGKSSRDRVIEVIPHVESPYKRSDEIPVELEHKYPTLRSKTEATPPSTQEIREARSISEMNTFLLASDYQKKETLLLSDIDDTLVSKETKGLVEGATTSRVIKAVQDRFNILGCTARPILEGQKTIAQLGSMEITLGTDKTRSADSVIALGTTSSYLYKGIIYAPPGSDGKGSAVHHFCSLGGALDQIRNVCMIDDKLSELEKVQAVCERMGMNFIGFHLKRS